MDIETPTETTDAVETPAPPASIDAAPTSDMAHNRPMSLQVAALQTQIETLLADKVAAETAAADAATAAAEAAAASMSEAERLEHDRSEWRAEVDAERGRLRGELRDAALDRAGVLGHYRGFVPDIDVRTTEGQRELETWIGDHPETVRRPETIPAATPAAALVARSSKVAEILTGKRKSTLINAKSLARMFDS